MGDYETKNTCHFEDSPGYLSIFLWIFHLFFFFGSTLHVGLKYIKFINVLFHFEKMIIVVLTENF
jgi:hypothetical protein